MTDPVVESIRGEYRRYRRMTELALEQVADADLGRRPDGEGNSIAVVIGHLAGNLRSRFTDFLDTDGEKPWRERDREFEDGALDRAQLLRAWSGAWEVVDGALDSIAERGIDVTTREVAIRGQPLTVLEALHRSLAHTAYHVGQIVLMARAFAGPAWKSLSIPRGGSASYAANPTKERAPDGR
jgi:hypothetical protein